MVEFEFWWLLIIPFFFFLGWIAARIDIKHIISETTDLPAAYFKGLNHSIHGNIEEATVAFNEALNIKPDSLELHIIQGQLLRKLGKIDQSINLHTKILNSKELNSSQAESIKAELIQDYFAAGFYDRCQALCNELKEVKYKKFKLEVLLDIAIKQRNWNAAIKTSEEFEKEVGLSNNKAIAHFLCELAVEKINEKKEAQAIKYLEQSLKKDKDCCRANIILGEFEYNKKNYKNAIGIWKKIELQNPLYLSLVLNQLLESYQKINNENEGLSLLSRYKENYRLSNVDNVIYKFYLDTAGPKKAELLARENLVKEPSIKNLDQFYSAQALHQKKNKDVEIIQQVIKNTIGNKYFHICEKCGFKTKQFHWQCAACNSWDSMTVESEEIKQ